MCRKEICLRPSLSGFGRFYVRARGGRLDQRVGLVPGRLQIQVWSRADGNGAQLPKHFCGEEGYGNLRCQDSLPRAPMLGAILCNRRGSQPHEARQQRASCFELSKVRRVPRGCRPRTYHHAAGATNVRPPLDLNIPDDRGRVGGRRHGGHEPSCQAFCMGHRRPGQQPHLQGGWQGRTGHLRAGRPPSLLHRPNKGGGSCSQGLRGPGYSQDRPRALQSPDAHDRQGPP